MQHFKFLNWWIGEFVVSFFDVTNRLKLDSPGGMSNWGVCQRFHFIRQSLIKDGLYFQQPFEIDKLIFDAPNKLG